MFCPQCGTESRDDATYCPECGGIMNEEAAKPVESSRATSSYGQQPQSPGAGGAQYHQPSPHSQPYQSPGVPGYGVPIPHVPDYLVPSILLTICCCPLLGAFALLYSAYAKTRLAYGDVQGAKEDANRARNALLIGAVLFLIYIAIYAVCLALGVSSSGAFDQFNHMKNFERF